jgi:outer membrane beta-barrel protein
MRTRLSLLALASLGLFAAPAAAQSKFTSLEDEPAIRHKIEYRDGRFELVLPMVAPSLASGLQQALLLGGRVKYHLSDVFAIGATGFFGLSFPTGTFSDVIAKVGQGQLDGGLNDLRASDDATFDPLRRVRQIKFGASLDGEFTPIYGKMSLFGKVFARYDLSLILGVTGVQTAGIIPEVAPAEGNDPVDPRIIPAPHFGVGTRVFLSDFMALNFEVRDTLILDNFNGAQLDGVAQTKLNNWWTLGAGLSLFFPMQAKLGK